MTRYLAPGCVIAALVLAAPVSLNSAPTATGRAMADAATAFLKDLNAEQRSKASFKFEDDSRFEFRFTPRARTGLPLKEMSDAQRTRAHALVKTGLSMRGYTNAQAIIDLENVLKAIEPPRTGPNAIVRDPEMYFVSIYGDPNGKTPWGWKFEGHHIAVNFSLVDGKPIVFAPSFFGSNPAVVKEGPQAGKRALREEEESGRGAHGGVHRRAAQKGDLHSRGTARNDHRRKPRSEDARRASASPTRRCHRRSAVRSRRCSMPISAA